MNTSSKSACVLLASCLAVFSGCTCYIPRTGGIACTTNHRSVASFDELEERPEYLAKGTVEHIKMWDRKPFSIANTADCEREIRLVLRIDTPAEGDVTRERVVLTYRGHDPIGIPFAYDIDDLFEGDRVDLGYDLDRSGEPTRIVIVVSRETIMQNREASDKRNEAEWQRWKPTQQ